MIWYLINFIVMENTPMFSEDIEIFYAMNPTREYIDENSVPFNSLYKKGFKSIGCQPCSRAVSSGEDGRSGRWWWEVSSEGKKECGLH